MQRLYYDVHMVWHYAPCVEAKAKAVELPYR